MNEPDWTTHITSGTAWRRFGLMVVFAPILACVGLIIAFTALFQFFNVLAQGEPSPSLGRNGRELGGYACDIISFLTYNSEKPPFPFTGEDEPGTETAANKTSPKAAAPHKKKATARKKTGTARKKTTTRRTTASKKTMTKKTSETRATESPPEQLGTDKTSE